MQLTPHFTLKEFTRSDTARARQVDNTPSPAAAAILRRLAQTLEQGDRRGCAATRLPVVFGACYVGHSLLLNGELFYFLIYIYFV
ncbi:hypothetical protein WK90_14895 [Burkholderia cepacia]|uniref:hypothetical protein n=1 Tax=Burkholderia cepacia TaxID=292 RepID=UPI000754AF4E|nr:hypothetical protein [Burkholderia cepacia]KVV64671.1 hypothetical protein WK83_05025 [Burkholderia cepacia]KVV82800.1 hypothetical protein WK86_20435 [Burkholderia cepacia]KVV86479.1 hypothetical protein WK88_29425 [Burkholderia cepacia]KVV90179.1 hypothetical protein WK87_15720 [Burkholderia cepacia]KVV96547.1 hypothetical protein WK89_26890 [Burkholderia cepacia]